MGYDNKKKKGEPIYSIRLRAGKRRTYFFDVRPTRSDDFYLTITESKRKFNDDGYDRHKIFLYKEDFNKFVDALQKTLDHIKENLLPEYDFDEFTREITDDQIDAVPVEEVLGDDTDSGDESSADDTPGDFEVDIDVPTVDDVEEDEEEKDEEDEEVDKW